MLSASAALCFMLDEHAIARSSPAATAHIVAPSRWHVRLSSFRVWGPLLHVGCLLVFFVGVTERAVVLAVCLYWVRMFGMTGGYHRYFAHRAYRTSRVFQFMLGFLGCMGLERGPLWWSATHRAHHRHSDQPEDVHSPVQRGFWHAHVGWVAAVEQMNTDLRLVRDLERFPELRWLDRYHWVSPVLGLTVCYLIAGASGVVLGGFWSTIAVWHGTFSVNSLSHLFGTRRFETRDDSRNHFLIAVYTMGEGWHNNHHRYMRSARQGFRWWELDLSYYVLRGLAAVGLIWDLKQPPAHLLRGESAPAPARSRRRRERPPLQREPDLVSRR